jgi:Carboxypeptidase regulatory-like domain
MSDLEIVRRRASIAGMIVDFVTNSPVPGALVAITSGPADFEALIAALAADLGWSDQDARPDRQLTGPDGVYCFMDLPAGSYDLEISVPAMSSRYGVYTRNGVQVAAAGAGEAPIWPAWAATPIQPTCATGQVTRADTNQPIAGAQVWLHSDTNVALTDNNGIYMLSGLVAGTVAVEVAASGFKPASQPNVVLAAGQKQTVNVSLKPIASA